MIPFVFGAFVGAVISTLPLGPINLILIRYALNGQLKSWWAIAAGIILADLAVCIFSLTIAMQTGEILGRSHWINLHREVFLVIFGLITCAMGLGMILKERRPKTLAERYSERIESRPSDRVSLFFFGGVSTLLTPTLMVFWTSWWLYQGSVPDVEAGLIFLGIALAVIGGDLIVFSLYRSLVVRIGQSMQHKFLKRLEISLNYSILAFGIFCAGSGVLQLISLGA